MDIYTVLLHYPVYNKSGSVVATSVANMDIHDISRAARTYGVRRFYIVTPVASQRELVKKIIDHWKTGHGSRYNDARREAFQVTEVRSCLEDIVLEISEKHGSRPVMVVTGAGFGEGSIRFRELRERLSGGEYPFLLIFGTGWGIADEVIKTADFMLEPIVGRTSYNHLPVRAAVAVTLDRLAGAR